MYQGDIGGEMYMKSELISPRIGYAIIYETPYWLSEIYLRLCFSTFHPVPWKNRRLLNGAI